MLRSRSCVEKLYIYLLLVTTLGILLNGNINAVAAEYVSDRHEYTYRQSFFDNDTSSLPRSENGFKGTSNDTPLSALQTTISTIYSGWQSLSGPIRTDTEPAIARNPDGRLDAFVVGNDNGLWHRFQSSPGSNSWSAYSSLGGVIRSNSDLFVISNGDGRLEIFVVGTNHQIYHKWQTSPGGSTWSAYESLGGVARANSHPVAVSNSDGRLQLFVIGSNNEIYHKVQTGPGSSTYSSYQSLGGPIKDNTNLAVARNSDGRLEIFAIGTNSQLYHKWQIAAGGTSWSAWSSLQGNIISNPAVIRNSDGRLDVFAVGSDNSLWHRSQTSSASSTSWTQYQTLGGNMRDGSDVSLSRNADGRLEVFVVQNDNALWHKWQITPGSATWSAFESLQGAVRIGGDPAAIANKDGRLEVFVPGTDNALWHKWQTQTMGSLPTVKDPNLTVEHFAQGLVAPTSMAVLDSNNILVLQKSGAVRLISNGQLQPNPVLTVPVDSASERGLLGVAIAGPPTNFVFLYYTAQDDTHKVVRYVWDGQNLINGQIILTLPKSPGLNHDGGKLMIGSDGVLYGVIGDLNRNGKLQNFATGPDPDDTSIIFRVNQDGTPSSTNPFFSDPDMRNVFAYGIRNSFGITFDPVNENLWDTENGPDVFDEINMVSPGFNSGWEKVMGPIALSGITTADLVNFPGSSYTDPVMNWRQPIGITDLEVFSSSQLGPAYRFNLFVGDINNGNLYFLTFNQARTGFVLTHPGLSDKIVDNSGELASITLITGFSGVTDLMTASDGLLYVLSYGDGKIYRITQSP